MSWRCAFNINILVLIAFCLHFNVQLIDGIWWRSCFFIIMFLLPVVAFRFDFIWQKIQLVLDGFEFRQRLDAKLLDMGFVLSHNVVELVELINCVPAFMANDR